ncbi:MAG: ABC transporter substrate-binding protein [Bacteroidetes bacterium]|nr:ABC transporter substrate-binding protein [Bacteroidota bacterium]
MKIKKIINSIFIVASIATLVIQQSCNSNKIPKVAIIQDKPQEWADALKLGFTDGLAEQGYEIGKDVNVVPRSGAGDPATFSTIAQNFAKGDYAIIYTLGTQSTQEVFNLTKDKNILFGAVTDPVQAGFYKDNLQTPLANISGTQDLWPYPAQLDLIQQLFPNIKKIGILYNSSEVNSQISVDFISKECSKRNIELIKKTVAQESEVLQVTAALLSEGVELVFIPADNTAQTSASSIIAECDKKNIPVFTGISGIVESGALATVGTNYYELGKVNAKQAVVILFKGKQAKQVPVSIADKGDIYINMKVANKLGVKVPDAVTKKAFKIYN